MPRRRLWTFVALLALIGVPLGAAPAFAAPQPWLGMTVDVTVDPGGQSGLEATAWIPLSGGGATARTSTVVTAATTVSVREGTTVIASCVIAIGSDACGLIFPPITAGAHTVSYTFTDGTETATFGGVLFAVTSSAPLVSIQWQDAAGTWIDGSGIALPFFASATTSGRCLITNTSNAPGELAFTVSVTHPSGPATTVSITDTLDPGEQGAFTFYTGPVSGVSSVNCSGPILFPVASGANGGGNGGGVIAIAGTITASTLEVDPGGTVTITGAGLLPPVSADYAVSLDGTDVPGSPVTLSMPAGDFSLDVMIPAGAAPGSSHVIVVRNVLSPDSVAFASFTVTVRAAALADTGTDPQLALGVAALLLGAGSALVLLRRRIALRLHP